MGNNTLSADFLMMLRGMITRSASSWSFRMNVINPEHSPVLREFIDIEPPPASTSLTTPGSEQQDLQVPGLPPWVNRTNHFGRQDSSLDSNFYDFPRLVTHIDDTAIGSLTQLYSEAVKPGSVLVDLCTSWVSHLPSNIKYTKVVGVGMNVKEMESNNILTEHHLHDLNTTPDLQFLDDASCDHVLCCVSVDYLIQPYKVFTEVNRVLKPGGTFIISFSNRCFFTKAIFCLVDDKRPLSLVYCVHLPPPDARLEHGDCEGPL